MTASTQPPSAASKRGKRNRRHGHDTERLVVNYLRSVGYPDAHTTRSRLGHDGTRQPGDVVGPVALVISVKSVKSSAWPSWCRQVVAEADGRPWLVVRREAGNPNVEDWPCQYGAAGQSGHGEWTFGAFIRWFDRDPLTPIGETDG